MSEHRADIRWQLANDNCDARGGYSRNHTWTFDGGSTVEASSAPAFSGDPACVDPEEAFVASISSCHMLWFLHVASDAGFNVKSYVDSAVGTMESAPLEEGGHGPWITRVVLRPHVEFNGVGPTPVELQGLHRLSHERCFIANSVRTAISVEPRQAP